MGGLEKLLVEYARCADRERVKLGFVCLGYRGHLADTIEEYGWPVQALNTPEGLRPDLALRLANVFRRWKADVVHTHDLKPLVYTAAARKITRVQRWVHTWHGKILRDSKRERWLFDKLGGLPDHIVAVSEDAAKLLIREGAPPAKVQTIWNGIDTSRFAYSGPNRDGNLITVARLSPEKDVQNLIRAMAIVKQNGNGVALEVGGYGECLPELQQLTEQLSLQGSVQFLGKVDDVPTVLARSKVFVLPSKTEGISLTLLEAAARGLPIVATRVGGNPEVVQDGVTGLLVPAESPQEMASAILQLSHDAATCQRMGKAGRNRVEQCFDIRRMVRTYEDLYCRNVSANNVSDSAKPRIVSNNAQLPQATEFVRCTHVPLRKNRQSIYRNTLTYCWQAYDKDVVVLDQEPLTLSVLCALRMLWPFGFGPLVSADLVLSRPGSSWTSRIKAGLKRMLLRQVDLFLMHLKDKQALKDVYGIPPQRLRYIPFKVNRLDIIEKHQNQTGSYVFTGGRSRRDYRTFCTAMTGLDFPGKIVAPPSSESSQHGTNIEDLNPPDNVELLHDDGSLESWVEKIAGARVVVFCIDPQTISPSGVSAYLMAMALKKCVIISDSPSTRGILEHEQTAILVPMRDPHTLREAIRKVWEDDDYRTRIAEGGYRYAMSLGGQDRLIRDMAREVQEIVVSR